MKKIFDAILLVVLCMSMTMVSCKKEEPEGPDKPGTETPTNPQEPDKPADPENPVEPVLPKDSTTVYFVNAPAWDAVNAYVWLYDTDEAPISWPGKPATKCSEKVHDMDVYSYKWQTDQADMIIFHNGIGEQTQNLPVDSTKPYYYNEVWYASIEEVIASMNQNAEEMITIYYVNVLDWEQVYASVDVATNPWPGELAQKQDEIIFDKEIYAYTFPKDRSKEVIFNNGDRELGNQTPLVNIEPEKPYFYMGQWFASLDDIPVRLVGTHNDNEYVDLGLPSGTLWAIENIGADTEYAAGDFFAWGELNKKDLYSWSNYFFCDNVDAMGKDLNKYNTDPAYGQVDYVTQLAQGDDIAHESWGGDWQIPTIGQWEELIKNCKFEQIDAEGKKMRCISLINGNYILLPYAGHIEGSISMESTRMAEFWTAQIPEADTANGIGCNQAYYFKVGYNANALILNARYLINRCNGLNVRPCISRSID